MKKYKKLILWLNTRRILQDIEEISNVRTNEILKIIGGFKHLLYDYLLHNPNAIKIQQLKKLNKYLTRMKKLDNKINDNIKVESDSKSTASLLSLPSELLVHITTFIPIKTVNKLKNLCFLFCGALLPEITKRNMSFKIMTTPLSVDNLCTNTDIPWHQYRLTYLATYSSVMNRIEKDFNIPQKYQLLSLLQDDNAASRNNDVEMLDENIFYNDYNDKPKIYKDQKYMLVDSRKFKMFNPKNMNHILYKANSFRYITFKYIQILSCNSVEIDYLLIHDDFNMHSLCLKKYLQSKSNIKDVNFGLDDHYPKISKKQTQEISNKDEFASYLLKRIKSPRDKNKDINKLLFVSVDGYIFANPSQASEVTVGDICEFENSDIYFCEQPIIQSVLMNKIPIKYVYSNESADSFLSILAIKRSENAPLFMYLIINESGQYGRILVFECINTNSLECGDIPEIVDDDDNGLPIVSWEGMNFIDWEERDLNKIVPDIHHITFNGSRMQSFNLCTQFQNIFHNAYMLYRL